MWQECGGRELVVQKGTGDSSPCSALEGRSKNKLNDLNGLD